MRKILYMMLFIMEMVPRRVVLSKQITLTLTLSLHKFHPMYRLTMKPRLPRYNRFWQK